MLFTVSAFLKRSIVLLCCVSAFQFSIVNARGDVVIDFEELTNFTATGATGSYYDGYSDAANTSGWTSRGASFNTGSFGPGWSYSNVNAPTTSGYGNQWSSFTGTGVGGFGNYALGTGYVDVTSVGGAPPFNPLDVNDLALLPTINLPSGMRPNAVQVSNATVAAFILRDGNQFAKKFGGPTGNDPDFFKLSIFGINAFNQAIGNEVEFYLADYRFTDNTLDYITNQWNTLDLTPLANATSLHFNISSSDVGNFGMNSPAFFAIDNLSLIAVPEPSSLALVLSGLALTWKIRQRRRKVFEPAAN